MTSDTNNWTDKTAMGRGGAINSDEINFNSRMIGQTRLWPGIISVIAGGSALAYGLTCLIRGLKARRAESSWGSNDLDSKRDQVEQASEDSFPASDAPAWNGSPALT